MSDFWGIFSKGKGTEGESHSASTADDKDLKHSEAEHKERSNEAQVIQDSSTGLAACVTLPFNRPNQDAAESVMTDNLSVAILADGVGSLVHSRVAAQLAVRRFAKELRSTAYSNIDVKYLVAIYEMACQDIRLFLSSRELEMNTSASTLLCAVELSDRFLVLYAGDGGIFVTRGRGTHATSLLMPHVDHREHLEATIGAEPLGKPAGISLTKSLPDGEVLVIGSDGAFPPGRKAVRAGNLIADLRKHVSLRQGELNQSELDDFLRLKVREYKKDDDTSLGVLVSRETLHYWRKEFRPKPSHY